MKASGCHRIRRLATIAAMLPASVPIATVNDTQ